MKIRWMIRGVSALAALTFVFTAAPQAFAAKEKFVRDKPHVNVDDTADVAADDAKPGKAEQKARKKAEKQATKKQPKRDKDQENSDREAEK